MGNIARMDPKLPSKFRDVSWPSLQPLTRNLFFHFFKMKGLTPPPPPPLKASLFIKFAESKMFIVFVCVQFFKIFGCHYNQRGLLKIEILILLRLARFQNSGTPPIRPSTYKGQPKSATYRSAIRFRAFCEPQLYVFFVNELWDCENKLYQCILNADFELDLSHWIKIIS